MNWHEWIRRNDLKRANWNEWIETNELKWSNWFERIELNEWHDWIEMTELTWMKWNECIEPNELKRMTWHEWIEINDLKVVNCPKWEKLSGFICLLCEIEFWLQFRAHFVDHFPVRGAHLRKQRPSSGDHGRPLYPKETQGFAPKVFSAANSHDPDRSHFPTTWWWCDWHDVVAMMVRQL